jgi:hypothetical protein
MRNVDALRSQFARCALREAAQGKLPHRESTAEFAKPFTLAEAPVSRIAPKAAGRHAARGLLNDQKGAKCGDFQRLPDIFGIEFRDRAP